MNDNVYKMSSDINRPLAMRAFVRVLRKQVNEHIAAGDMAAAVKALVDAQPRFNRLGGVEVLKQLDDKEPS